jgi:L-alanine-DL-glutamate epimerase-like enolase superfamily enzyme
MDRHGQAGSRSRPEHFRIPLDAPASDSTHGVMTSFELITARVTDGDGEQGVGYTYTTGHNGGAVHHLLAREIAGIVAGADCELIEALWQKVWWALHYGGPRRARPCWRSRPSTWRCGTSRRGGARLPLYRPARGARPPACRATPAAIDLDLTVGDLLAQTDGNLKKGFRAIKTKVGRDLLHEDVERIGAMRSTSATASR